MLWSYYAEGVERLTDGARTRHHTEERELNVSYPLRSLQPYLLWYLALERLN